MPKIEIDGKSYDTDKMSDDAKKMLGAVQLADVAIKRTQAQLMIARTAKQTYLNSLEKILNK